MLLELDIRDFALIAELNFRPEPGFVVLTGETGAGKSILIGALAQLSGDRADTSMVRSGSSEARLSAVFSNGATHETMLARDILASGRTVARLDGRIVPLTQLREAGERLIAIHGQRENQRIFDETTHRPLLDRFCRTALEPILADYTAVRDDWLQARQALHAYGADPAARARAADLLAHQIREIRAAAPVPGEEEKLQEKARLQKTLSKVYAELAAALDGLAEAESGSAIERVEQVRDNLTAAAAASKTVAALRARLDECLALLDGIRHDLSRFFEKIDLDPAVVAETEARLDVYGKLKYKYGSRVEDILAYLHKSEREYERLTTAEETIQALTARLAADEAKLLELAAALHDVRSREAAVVAADIAEALAELDMKNVHVDIEVTVNTADWSLAEHGRDSVRFLISPNLGEPLLPLAKIASGGEAARVLLALKSILAEIDDVDVLVFDEIDAGISGHTARLVGSKLRALGRFRHVFCVTHSASIAAAADHHYLISKHESEGRTQTHLHKLDGDARVAEIARLLSGRADDTATRRLAETMLADSRPLPNLAQHNAP